MRSSTPVSVSREASDEGVIVPSSSEGGGGTTMVLREACGEVVPMSNCCISWSLSVLALFLGTVSIRQYE